MFRDKLKENRIRLEMNQKALSMKLNVSEEEVSKWEIGISMPDIETAIKLSEIFNVSIDYLLKDSKSDSSFSYYTKTKDNKRIMSIQTIASISFLTLSFLSLLTLLVIAWIEPITYISSNDEVIIGIKAYMYKYQEFNTAVIFSIGVLILSVISLFVPIDKVRKLFQKKM